MSTPKAAADFCLLYITTPNSAVAETLATTIVSESLAACGNIFPQVKSIYKWDDKLQNDDEVVLILKTRSSLLAKVLQRVEALHPYDCPCIVSVPLSHGNETYLQWIDKQTNNYQLAVNHHPH